MGEGFRDRGDSAVSGYSLKLLVFRNLESKKLHVVTFNASVVPAFLSSHSLGFPFNLGHFQKLRSKVRKLFST